MEEARGKPSFCKWRAKIENAKGTENVNERIFAYGGCKFVWGGNNQEDKERRLLSQIITVTNNNSKNRQNITAGDADAKLGAPMKKRRHLEQDEALPLVCRLPAYKKWEALADKIEMVCKQRIYIKGVHGMEEKLLMAMVNNAKKKLGQLESGDHTVENAGSDRGGSGSGGGSGGGNVHGTDEKSQSLNTHPRTSNNIPPAISQMDVEGTLHANGDKELDVSLDAANCDDHFC
jgi:hypothetical protein